jgi:xanthine dehydrogenase YagS FAD-binding subunit
MIIRDVMAGFEFYRPITRPEAIALCHRFGADGWKLAGGNDSLNWFKDRIKKPTALIDLSRIADLTGIRESDAGFEIGAMTTLRTIAEDTVIRGGYRLLSDAAAKVASPQIRASATIGGNLCQHARCWYYRAGQPCYRAGGHHCFARADESVNREHALFDASLCMAVTPSDIAPALVALDATLAIDGPAGPRTVDAASFFVGPDVDVTNLTSLHPDEILVAIRLPRSWKSAFFYFEKVADRQVWDFPLVNVAVSLAMTGDVISDARIVCGGIGARPKRFPDVESMIKGKGRDMAAAAGQLATTGAKPLSGNGYKVPLLAGLVTRALREAWA